MAMPLLPTRHGVADILSSNIGTAPRICFIMRNHRFLHNTQTGGYTMMKPHISLIRIMRRRRDGYAVTSNAAWYSRHPVFKYLYCSQGLFLHEEPHTSS
ncbi:hypothetical protein J6590_101212 [Homalodisca vitripennis]|nr:hypothetical protein J6590_101212 [Homalodisca vitripennis]